MGLDILIFTDSLALPRLHPEFCHQNETWTSLLRKQGHRITQVSIGGGTSHDLVSQCNYYQKDTIDIDLVIVQSGIVDCAPRFAHKLELKLYQVLPLIGKKIIRLLNRNWVRQVRNITYMPLKKYSKNIRKIQQNFKPYPVLFLGILPASKAYECQLRGITKNTALYNDILKETGAYIDLSQIPESGIMSDYHHVNSVGHQFIFEQIQKAIQAHEDLKLKSLGDF